MFTVKWALSYLTKLYGEPTNIMIHQLDEWEEGHVNAKSVKLKMSMTAHVESIHLVK